MFTKEEYHALYLKYKETHQKYKKSEAGKAAEARYRKTEKYKISTAKSGIKARAKNRERQKIWNLVNKAIETGVLLRHKCEVCGMENALAHHDDYSKPFEIRWFCIRHHTKYHLNLKEVKDGN